MSTDNEEDHNQPNITDEKSDSSSNSQCTSPPAEVLCDWTSRYLKKTDQTLSRLANVLSTPSGTDTVLMTICYVSLLSSTILTSISLARLRSTARLLINKVLTLPPETTILLTMTTIPSSRLLKLSVRLKALNSLISDVRIFARLWGLLAIWTWGKAVYLESPGDDKILNQIERLQVLVNLGYQYLENYAYLSGKGVLGWSQQTQLKAWAWSSKFSVLHVMLELVRLWREKSHWQSKGKCKVDEERRWISDWKKRVLINLAYTPLTLHWSSEKGLLNDFFVGLLGSVIGGIKVSQAWKKTSKEE